MSLPPLGVLQLDKTNFARPPGDVSNPQSWPFPIIVSVVRGACAAQAIEGGWGEDLVLAFVREGRRLIEEEGCVALVTSCGLATMHPLLSSHLPSIGTSALLQLPLVHALFPCRSIGVISLSNLSLKHFTCVGASPNTPFTTVPQDGIFARVLAGEIAYDHDGMKEDVLSAARELADQVRERGGELRAIVLECANMPPFSAAVAREMGVQVFDVITLGKFLYSAAVKEDLEYGMPSPPRGL